MLLFELTKSGREWEGANLKKNGFSRLLFALLLIILILMVFYTPIFAIKNIIIKNNRVLSQKDIICYSNINIGDNIFKINKKQIKQNLLRNPWIQEVDLKRILPSTVIISVTEKKECAALYFLGSFIKIDSQGYVLEITQNLGKNSLPIITGIDLVSYSEGNKFQPKVAEKFELLIDFINLLDKYQMSEIVCELNLEDLNNIVIYFVEGIEARIGSYEKMDEKLYMLKGIIADVLKNNRKNGYIEMRGVHDPVFKSFD
jgi:cell division protein FtsQ